MKRRSFLQKSIFSGLALSLASSTDLAAEAAPKRRKGQPIALATWNVKAAIDAAAEVLKAQGRALDAVEKGVMVEEADPKDMSVGYGGLPDRDGHVTLDACIMDEKGNAGSVLFLQDIMHPVSVARKVMEDTPHVILAGEGARQFAISKGFEPMNLLTPEAEKAWKEWLKTSEYSPKINVERHDTIGMLALDFNGDLSGACTTSGLSYKMHGRVGDSPIIGAGLFVDNEVGAATATGLGEAVLKTLGTFLIVEFMRQGKSPQKACELAIERVVQKVPIYRDIQIGFIAVNTAGQMGAFAIHKGFNYTVFKDGAVQVIEAGHYLK